MPSVWSLLLLAHLIGLSICIGAATVKLILLTATVRNPAYSQTFVKVSKPITKTIIFGLVLVTASGIGWIFLGYNFSTLLIAKLVLVLIVWALGPYIDTAIDPKFAKLAPAGDQSTTPAFQSIRRRYLILETVATAILYVALIMGWRL